MLRFALTLTLLHFVFCPGYHRVQAQGLSLNSHSRAEVSVAMEKPIGSIKSTSAPSGGEVQLLAPLAEDDLFFSPPDQKKAVQSTAKGATIAKRQDVQLLGVGRVGSLETDEVHAILKIDGQLLYKRIGDSFGDIEVVDIGRRSVALQSGRERWTIELFQQPLTNKSTESAVASPAPRKSRIQQNRKPSAADSTPTSLTIEPKTLPPSLQVGPPADPAMDVPKLPELDLPPPAPELPDFSSAR